VLHQPGRGYAATLRKLISTFKEILEMRLNFNSYKMQLFRVDKTFTTFICIDANNNDAAVPDQDPVSPRRAFTN
jgi:hypothetical protein